MLILKSACLLIALFSRDKPTHKDDKIVQQKKVFRTKADRLPLLTAFLAAINTAIYLLLIVYGAKNSKYRNSHNSPYLSAALTQLQTVKPWHIAAAIGAVLGYTLRKWSYVALDESFTIQLKVRVGQKLITHGPYRYLRHPSYTGFITTFFCTWLLLLHEGLWDVMTTSVVDQIRSSWLNTTAFGATILSLMSSLPGIGGRICFMGLATIIFKSFLDRIVIEEEMLKSHFGREWDNFASKRWRLVPFVY
ncbi:hypothetical protein BCR41DRAFT_409938 [Lobosporangium transversale]|uniref:Protein-S-isoprenylcysteine O-methyltransferase n=1 Tax=Lobosporangium transversale TaxID=64571 RepID=A0A1Y2H2V0_9FUNG|nr:hypothetical protein BCR41DRAFT_409938 [Lobosporangium transversale]ORZ28033.1 hypothetical protein BCR41DRAFT_409938 [Lobosporangium transversale]|eukprot:XP_021885736.1 hypothetical protein BCR41DRAFT_409938 [Lobosporangium transversale]